MMGFFRRLFAQDDETTDELGDELRAALAVLVKRALPEGWWKLTAHDCSIRGLPIGNWTFTVERSPAQAIEARSGETEGLDPKGESAVPKGCAQ